MFVVVLMARMERGVHCTDVGRELIKNLKNEGKPMAEIAKFMKCSTKKYFPQFILNQKVKSVAESAKPPKCSTSFLLENQKKNPFLSSEDHKKDLNAPVISRNIRNRLI